MAKTSFELDGKQVDVFTSSDTFTATKPISGATVLLVGGGGAGGNTNGGGRAPGGGGAGGAVLYQNVSIPQGDSPITVGAGGTATSLVGGDSTFLQYIAHGGGAGRPNGAATPDGGSGGGGSAFASGDTSGGSGVTGQGYKGGSGHNNASYVERQAGGGGGGAGGAGQDAQQSVAGDGGPGADFSSFFGTTVGDFGWFSSGGGGGKRDSSSGAGSSSLGGGGAGGNNSVNGESATANTGGGGGGGKLGGDGGSGVVIVLYDKPTAASPSKVAGIVQIDGAPAERTVRAFSYESVAHSIDGADVIIAKSLGQATSDPDTGEYTIDLLAGYDRQVFVVAFDDYGADFSPELSMAVGDRVHPSTPNGYVWECAGAGTLPSEEPAWVIDTETAQLYGTASMIAKPFYRPMVHGPVMPEVTDIVVNGDEYFANVSLLLHFSEPFSDSSSLGHNLILDGEIAAASEGKFGTGGQFDGTDDRLAIANTSALDFGTGDFTLEAWVNWQGTSNSFQNIIGSAATSYGPGSAYFLIY